MYNRTLVERDCRKYQTIKDSTKKTMIWFEEETAEQKLLNEVSELGFYVDRGDSGIRIRSTSPDANHGSNNALTTELVRLI